MAMSDVSQGPDWWQAADGKWYPPAASAVPVKKPFYKRVWFWLLVVVALFFGGCITVITSASVAVHNAATQQHTVVYAITGSGTADITYDTFQNGSSGTSQETGVSLPWSKTLTASGLFSAYSLTASNGSGSGSLACTITVDGKVISHNVSSGQYANVACTGSN